MNSLYFEPPAHAIRYVWIAFAVSAILAWPVLILMRRLRANAMISQYTPEHAGKVGTPSMGGLAPLAGSIVALLAMPGHYEVWALIIALTGFGLLGYVDDFVVPRTMPGKRGLGWTQKLIIQLVLAAVVGWVASPVSTVQAAGVAFSCLFFANAVNFSDGLDALCGGLLVISMLTLAAISVSPEITIAFAATLVPFLVLNVPPAKIFMGDVGALAFGAAFGVLVSGPLFTFGDAHYIFAAIAVSAVFVVELCSVPLQLFWVKVFKRRLIPASPVHHSFEKLGWPETRITGLLLLTQVTLGLLAITIRLYGYYR